MMLRAPLDSTLPARDAFRGTASGASAAPLSWATALGWSVVVAGVMSTQLLFQPFIWRNFEWDEILDAWFELAWHRGVVAVAIALAIKTASHARPHSPLARSVLLGLAIVAGALAGELTLVTAGSIAAPSDSGSVLARVVQWCSLAASISSLVYLWRRAGAAGVAAQETELRRIQMERQIVQARLQTLRSQIEPHFLFNTLATVRRLQHTEQDQGAELLAHFLAYLRSTLPERSGGRNTLGQEIDLVRAYLGVVSVRMAGRLVLHFDVPEDVRGCEFPALTVATLVENAVKHGIGPAPGGGSITVQAGHQGDMLEVVVADTGVGFSGSGGSGMGLSNTRSRLQTLYGTRGVLTLAANQPCGVRATMRLPASAVGEATA